MQRTALREALLWPVAALALCALVPAESLASDVVDKTNWQQVVDRLPESVLNWIKSGDLQLALGEMRDEVSWESSFLEASAANADRYDIDANGGLIDRHSGVRPPHTYGFPFPQINAEDPRAGVKVMWNAALATYKYGRLFNPFAVTWIGRNGFERIIKGQVFGIAFDFQPEQLPNPDRTETRDLFQGLSPASAEGTITLTWRYLDQRPDSVWGYTPALRRIRQLTAANRSDPFLGADVAQDDGLLWLGKNQSFTWKLLRAQDVLVGAVVTSHVQLVPGQSHAGGQEWKSPATFPGIRLGLAAPGWRGAPWLPANLTWVSRPAWVVEGEPKDPYYNYGRQLFYIDRVTYKIYYKVIHTRAGEYWKTLFNDLGIGVTPDGERRYVMAGGLVAVDDRAGHATFASGNAPDFITEYNSARARPELFTLSGMSRLAK